MDHEYVFEYVDRCIPFIIPYEEGTRERVVRLMGLSGMKIIESQSYSFSKDDCAYDVLRFYHVLVVVKREMSWDGFAKIYVNKQFMGRARKWVVAGLMKKVPELNSMIKGGMSGQELRALGELWSEWKMMKSAGFGKYVEYVRKQGWGGARWRSVARLRSR